MTLLAVTFDFDCDTTADEDTDPLSLPEAGTSDPVQQKSLPDQKELILNNARWVFKLYAKTAEGVEVWQREVKGGNEVSHIILFLKAQTR